MTDTPEDEESALVEKLERMKRYLNRYENKLFNLVTSLEKEEDLDAQSKALDAVVTRFEKVALKFFELRYKLEEYREKENKTGVLDTAAAKDEILRRLDRIRQSSASDQAD